MGRKFLLAALGIVMLGIGVLWFFHNFEQVTVKRRTEPQAEARRNPYLALERFFARMGRPVERRTDARFLDALPSGGVLILDSGRHTHLTQERQKRLLAWVEQGGYLIVSPDFPDKDELMTHFDVSRYSGDRKPTPEEHEDGDEPDFSEDDKPESKPSKAGEGTLEKPAAKTTPARKKTDEDTLQVRIPGARTLKAGYASRGALQTGKKKPLWKAELDEGGAQYLHFKQGNGHVTIISGLLGQFSNRRIGEHDHAEILWTLVQTYQPGLTGPISLMTRLEIPKLHQWLAENARQALMAGALLLLLWLWRVVPRFGLLLPDAEPDRRQLREHLAAIGRYVWRSGGLPHWLSVAREAFQAQLALRHPALSSLPPAEQAEALARLTRRPVDMIAQALHGQADSVSAFTSAMRTLRNLERSL